MRLRRNSLIVLAVSALGLALLTGGLQAQEPPQSRLDERRQTQRPGPRGGGPVGVGHHLRSLFMRVARLPPEEQQHVLENDEFFRRLPSVAQERFRRRLTEFNALPPERRQHMLERWRHAAEAQRAGQALFLRLAPLPPEEQQRALESAEFFQKLPPPAQQRFRRHLEEFNSRPPEERQRMLEHFRRFSGLSPEQQEEVRRRARLFQQMSPEQRRQARRIFQAWQQLPPHRRRLLGERLRRLQLASPEERAALAQNPDFLAPLRENERHLLRGLWHLRQHLPQGPSDR